MVKEDLRNDEEKIFDGIKKPIAIIVAFVLILLLFNPIVIVPAGYRGVLLNFGQVQSVVGEGLSFRMPIMQEVVLMNVQTQKYEADAMSASQDLQDVHTSVALNYHISPEQIGEIYKTLGVNYANKVIAPAVQETVKASTALFTAEQLITQRPLVKDKIDSGLMERLQLYGFKVETISITNFKFSDQFTQSIESKVTAQQQALKAENDLTRIKVEAEQKIATARAEAESLRLQNEQLAKNKDVLQLRWIEKWDGRLPSVLTGGGDSSLLLNVPSLTSTARVITASDITGNGSVGG